MNGAVLSISGLTKYSRGSELYPRVTLKTGISIDKMSLMNQSRVLKWSETLAMFGLHKYSVIDLHVSRRGGGEGLFSLSFSYYYITKPKRFML